MGFVPILTAASRAGSPAPGTDPQLAALLKAVRGKRVGLIANPTSVDANLVPIADHLAAAPDIKVVAFFAPEHGLRGDRQAGAMITDYTDPLTGVPVYAVYGTRQAPTDEQLKDIDVLIYDTQDVGVRFYTVVWSMIHGMEAAARNHKKFIVYDRPNPLGCDKVEGAPNTLDGGLIGRLWPGKPFGIATRPGMTQGEIARMVNGEWLNPKADLEVIPIPNYTRSLAFEATRRPWVLPSPNMPTLDTVRVYPGTCIFEGTNLSEGRGTTRPFELIGAPFIKSVDLADALNALHLAGVRFRPCSFAPTFGKFKEQLCGGVQVHVLDPEAFDPIRTALFMVKTIYAKYPGQVKINHYANLLMGVPDLNERIKTESVDSIIAGWQENLKAFKVLRQKYLLYL